MNLEFERVQNDVVAADMKVSYMNSTGVTEENHHYQSEDPIRLPRLETNTARNR
jgi:hypothetical protein